ncbi:MAG: zf-HC2 domain-containing protein [Myxococcales bacterium]|nr:zf-HC2 domain-containing protein [Myxococcales bacterium]MCB9647314.1 zf-HC2 domain-containing protein [Deltaproteobacteria bacterium]
MAHDREVAGLRCTEVLARLSDYLDGDLSPEEVAQVQGHLRGCDWCERFGSQMGEVVGKLRRELATPPDAGPDVARRLMERLDLD